MKTYYLIVVASLFAASAHALDLFGPSTGGGGFVVACPATPVSQAKTELVDLYEGREVLGFTMAQASGDLAADYWNAVDRTYTAQGRPDLAEELRADIQRNLVKFYQSVKFVERAEDLPAAADLGERPWIPANCAISQVAFFDDSTQAIYVLRPLWAQMDTLSQAALVHHELFYRELRALKDTTSKYARRQTAVVYALKGPAPILDGVETLSLKYSALSSDLLHTADTLSSFYVTAYAASGVMRLQFDTLGGRPQLAKAYADVPFSNWNLRFGRSSTDPGFVGCIVGMPNQALDLEVPLQGITVDGLSLRYHVRTGEPVRLTLVNSGIVLDEGFVIGDQNCQGIPR